jgi:hypothetical protein
MSGEKNSDLLCEWHGCTGRELDGKDGVEMFRVWFFTAFAFPCPSHSRSNLRGHGVLKSSTGQDEMGGITTPGAGKVLLCAVNYSTSYQHVVEISSYAAGA